MGDLAVQEDGTVSLCVAVGWEAVGNINNVPFVFTNKGMGFSLLPAGGQNEQE